MKIEKILLSLFLGLVVFLPTVSFSQIPPNSVVIDENGISVDQDLYEAIKSIESTETATQNITVEPRGLLKCGDNCDFGDLKDLISGIVAWFFGIAASIAAIGFAVSGIKMLMNPDNSSKRAEAIEGLKKTGIGLLIALTGSLIVQTIAKEQVNTPDATRFFKVQNK